LLAKQTKAVEKSQRVEISKPILFCLSAGEKGIEGGKLLECLDKNHLYANYSEIDDEGYQISDENKKINKEFYQT
jgi:hypothetical protein